MIKKIYFGIIIVVIVSVGGIFFVGTFQYPEPTNNEYVNKKTVVFYTEKTEYAFGEPITIIMKNEGIETFSTTSEPIGFSIIDKNGEMICDWRGGFLAIDYFNPQEIITKTWEQNYCNDKGSPQVGSGTYTIIGNHFINYTNPLPRLDIRIVE